MKPYDKDFPPSEDWIPECPESGAGCHSWMYRAVNTLIESDWPHENIVAWVERWMSRDPQPNEIENTIRKVEAAGDDSEGYVAAIPKPPINQLLIDGFIERGGGDTSLEEIESYSPINVATISSGDTLRHLFSEDESTIVFTNDRSQGQLVWHHAVPDSYLDRVTGANESGAWMLLNPVTGQFMAVPRLGKDPLGRVKRSRRSEETLTNYKHVLVESDTIPLNKWLTLLKQLPLPIKSITLSGTESAHSILEVNATSKSDWTAKARNLASLLVPLGACPGSLTAVRLTRLPKVMRTDTKKSQRLLYLNPHPTKRPLTKTSSPS